MTLRETLRRLPPDAIAFLVIAVVLVVTHTSFIRHGMCFNDPAWMFHFGRKTLHGDVPYRDYVFQVGPLPIYVDAGFQGLFGERYVASLFAALFIKIVRVWVIWMLARRLAGMGAASALAVFCAFDPWFAFAHHWSTPYADLSITLAALFAVIASRSDARRALLYLALTGFCAAMVLASRQSSAVLIALVLCVGSTILLVRKDAMDRRRFAALWSGFAAGVLLLAIALALLGALGPAIQQMFLDAPAKKGVRGLAAVMDAVSGGALVDGRFTTKLRGFMFFIGIPLAVVACVGVLARSERGIKGSTIALLGVPGLMILGLISRDASFALETDLPRTVLSGVTALAVISPARLRRWFGLEPFVTLVIAGFALASDWALEMSFPGRGWGDVWALVTAVLLLALASDRLTPRTKSFGCVAFAVTALIHVGFHLQHDANPFAKPEASDGTLAENSVSPRAHGSHNPILRGLRIPMWRARSVEWLSTNVERRSSCFVYANLPSLYDLLACSNPTRIDTTIADFPSVRDAEEAVAAMRAHPPDYILAHERMWMSPPISLDLEGKIERYDSWNPRASLVLHVGLRSIIDQYESLGTVAEGIGPEYGKQAANHWDAIDGVRVYRRKR